MKYYRAYTYDLGTKMMTISIVPAPRDISNPLARLPLRTETSLLQVDDLTLVGCRLIRI